MVSPPITSATKVMTEGTDEIIEIGIAEIIIADIKVIQEVDHVVEAIVVIQEVVADHPGESVR